MTGSIGVLLGAAAMVIVLASLALWWFARPRTPSMEQDMRRFSRGRHAMTPRRPVPRPGETRSRDAHRLPPPKR